MATAGSRTRNWSTWLGEGMKAEAFILDTRPVLNFLAVDRLDLISTALQAPVYVSPSVVEEVRDVVNGFWGDVERRSRREPELVEPWEIGLAEDWRKWKTRLVPPPVRRLREVDLSVAELRLASQIRNKRRDLDPGECEVLAVAKARGWGVIIDEMPGHCWAEEESIPNDGTLGVLVAALRLGSLEIEEGERLWSRVKVVWPKSPPLSLAEYRDGRPLWRPCPEPRW